MKYVARIKLRVPPTSAYQNKQTIEIFRNDKYTCRYRYIQKTDNSHSGVFEFVYGNFEKREDAFVEGKKLYFNLLYLMNLEHLPFGLIAYDFSVNDIHISQKIGVEAPDKFYFCNHDFYNDYCGLEVYEINEDFFEEYDSDKQFCNGVIVSDLLCISNHKYRFDMLKDLHILYDDDAYRIFELLDKTNKEENRLIQLLLMSICYERLAEIVCSFYKAKEKQTCQEIQFIKICNKKKVDKKCIELVKKYKGNNYSKNKAKTIFNDMYKIRSEFAHGTRYDEKNVFKLYCDARELFLVIFKNFMEEKYNG